MKVIGLTGGIASGKSTVAKMLTAQGFAVVDADVAARDAVKKGSKGLAAVKEAFGEAAVIDGEMNRQYVGSIIFQDAGKRTILNNIIHPIVRDIMNEEKIKAQAAGKHVIMDIPLLYENKLEQTVDEVWVVYVPEEVQKQRLMARNALTDTEAAHRIASQLPIEEKRQRADVVIDNSGTLETLAHNVEKAVAQFFKQNKENE